MYIPPLSVSVDINEAITVGRPEHLNAGCFIHLFLLYDEFLPEMLIFHFSLFLSLFFKRINDIAKGMRE